jgi:hypothetical protein
MTGSEVHNDLHFVSARRTLQGFTEVLFINDSGTLTLTLILSIHDALALYDALSEKD